MFRNTGKVLRTSLNAAEGLLQGQQKRGAAGGVVKNKYVDELFTYREKADEYFRPNPVNFLAFFGTLVALPVGLMYLSTYSSHYVDDIEGFPHRRRWPPIGHGASLGDLSDEDPRDIARRRLAAGDQPWEAGQDERCRSRSVYNVVKKMKEANFPWPPPDSVYQPREWERPEWKSGWPQLEHSHDHE